MLLNNIEFPNVFNSSGARGFYGEGWPFHYLLRPFGLDYRGSGLITKTVTADPTFGHLKSKFFPDCIKVYPRKKCILNAVGLTNPGVEKFLERADQLPQKSIISLGFSGDKPYLQQLQEIGKWFRKAYLEGKLPENFQFAIELNWQCPNSTKLPIDPDSIQRALEVLDWNFLPQIPPILLKVGENFPLWSLMKLEPTLAGVSILNSLPWGHPAINWEKLFGTFVSPLLEYGGGALSGEPLFPLMLSYLLDLRQEGWKKPVIVGGGILTPLDLKIALGYGASAISLGGVSLLRPYRVHSLIQAAIHETANPRFNS